MLISVPIVNHCFIVLAIIIRPDLLILASLLWPLWLIGFEVVMAEEEGLAVEATIEDCGKRRVLLVDALGLEIESCLLMHQEELGIPFLGLLALLHLEALYLALVHRLDFHTYLV